MEGNDTEALGLPCAAKKNPLSPHCSSTSRSSSIPGVSWRHQANLPFNPLALVVAVVAVAETLGTPLWPKEDIPSHPPGHFLPYTIPVGGVSSKASQEMQSL